MKLIIATLTAATVLASAASAMLPDSQVDPRDAVQNETAQITTGIKRNVSAEQFGPDGRWLSTLSNGQVTVYSFEASDQPKIPADLR